MIESGLASSLASSLIILGCIPPWPIIFKVPPNPGLSMILQSTSAFQLFFPGPYPWDSFKQVSDVRISIGGFYTNNDFFL